MGRTAPQAAAWFRCHAAAGFAALSVLVGWALIVEMTGYFAFFMICNAVAGSVARPPRARLRRVAEGSALDPNSSRGTAQPAMPMITPDCPGSTRGYARSCQ